MICPSCGVVRGLYPHKPECTFSGPYLPGSVGDTASEEWKASQALLQAARAELGEASVALCTTFALLEQGEVQALMHRLTWDGKSEAAEALMRYWRAARYAGERRLAHEAVNVADIEAAQRRS